MAGRSARYFQNTTGMILACGLALALCGLLLAGPRWIEPAEDAAIMFQIVANFVRSGVIAYNLADGPAEGATDFLWMLSLAGLVRLGLPEFLAANLLSALALLATVALVARLAGPRHSLALPVFVAGLAVAPMLPAAMVGFSNLFFGAFLLAAAV